MKHRVSVRCRLTVGVASTCVVAAMQLLAGESHGQTAAISQWTWSQCSSPGVFQTYGWEFETYQPLLVTELGVWDYNRDGFARPHDIGIWDDSFAMIALGRVPGGTQAELLGDFRYVEIDGVLLEPDRRYYIAAFMDAEWKCTSGPFPVVAEELRFFGGREGSHGTSLSLPGTPKSGTHTLGPSFRFEVVPEPSSLASGLVGVFAVLGIAAYHRHRRRC